MNSTATTNATKVFKDFKELTSKEMKKALKSALNKASGKLRNETRSTLRTMMPSASKSSAKYSDRLIDAVRKSKIEETKKGDITSAVHIMGTRDATSGTYRLRFFEKGTRKRQTRKGYNRGIIQPLYFFRTASTAFKAEYNQILSDYIAKAVDKINNTKK